MQLLGRSICSVMPDLELDILGRMMMMKPPSVEKQESSTYEEMVTAIMNKLSLPLSYVLRRFQRMSLQNSSNIVDKHKVVINGVDRMLGETMVVDDEGDGCVSTLLERMRQLDNVDYALACSGMPRSLRQSLHAELAEKKRSLVPCFSQSVGEIRTKQHSIVGRAVPTGVRLLFRDQVLQLLGPSIYTLMPDLEMDMLARTMMLKPPPNIEKQESSTYEEMVTAIMNKLELPPTYEDIVLQSLQKMSLA